MIKKIIIVLCVVLVAFAVYTNMQKQKAMQNTGKKNVYAVLPLTGAFASSGKDLQVAMDAWIDSTPDIPFTVRYIDSESQPMKAVTTIQQALLDEKEPIVISAFSPISAALVPVVGKANGFAFLISTTDVTKLEQNGKFQQVCGGTVEDKLYLYPYVKKHFKKIAIAYTNEELGKNSFLSTKEYMGQNGVDIVEVTPLELSSFNVRIEAHKLIQADPDAILVFGQPTLPYINMFRELKLAGWKKDILTAAQFTIPYVQNGVGDLKDGIIFLDLDYAYDNDNPRKKAFFEVMKKRKEPVVLSASFSFNVLDVIKYVLDNNLPLTQKTFETMKSYDGLGGKIYFTGTGVSHYTYRLVKYDQGKIMPVE